MRARVTAVVVFLVIFGSLTASATSNESYKDKFESIGWGGSSGSLPWSGPWAEIGDDNDEKHGAVRVVSSGNCASGNCMSIDASLLPNVGARRTADTSIFGSAELRYDVNIIPGLDLGGILHVQVRPGSGGWTTLEQYPLGDGTTENPQIDISDYAAEALQLRFLVTGLLSTSQVYIDNVEIRGELLEEPTTTTTTTAPTTTTTTIDDATTTTTRPALRPPRPIPRRLQPMRAMGRLNRPRRPRLPTPRPPRLRPRRMGPHPPWWWQSAAEMSLLPRVGPRARRPARAGFARPAGASRQTSTPGCSVRSAS